MFKNKRDVDRHVTDILKKIKTENERYLRGFCISKLYFAIKDYECARRYLSGFLNYRENHAGGHKLMGQIFEGTNQYEKALQSYKRSLELDENQKDLILRVCDLYCRVPIDVNRARYWADRAEALFPHHSIVFQLRETMMKADGEQNFVELENLISSELTAKPKDLSLRIKLLKLYMDTDRVELAYDHAIKVEAHQPFSKSFDWYSCLEDIFEAYMEDKSHVLDTEFFVCLLSSFDSLVYLSLMNRSISGAADALKKFDKYMEKAKVEVSQSDDYWQEFLNCMQGQLYFYLGTYILKRAKMDQGKWKESSKMSAALFLTSLHFNLDLKKQLPKSDSKLCIKMLERCRAKASYRTSQAGHIVLCMSTDPKMWLQQIKQQCGSTQIEFTKELLENLKTSRNKSYFMNSSSFCDVEYKLMSSDELKIYDEDCVKRDPENLQQLVWLCLLRCDNNSEFEKESIKLASSAFQNVQETCSQESFTTSGSPETFCRLDAEAFLLATIMATKWERQYRKSVLIMSSDKPVYMPLIASDSLCSADQEQWWKYTYRLCCQESRGNIGDIRRVVQHGIEVIRAMDNNGLGVRLLSCFAKYFSTQVSNVEYDFQNFPCHLRSMYYWKKSIDLLERLSSNLTIVYPKNRLFNSSIPEPSNTEVKSLLDTGRIYLANDAFSNGDYDTALKMFQKVNTAEAAFNQVMVFKKLAYQEEENSRNHNADTSEVLDRRNAFLIRARDNCYLALDRIRGEKNHPLLHNLMSEVKSIEAKLRGINSDEGSSSESEMEPNTSHLSAVHHSTPKMNIPKSKPKLNFPSPQRLELQIRSLAVGQEELVQSVMNQNRALIETNRAIVEELKINKSIIDQLRDEMTDIHKDLANMKIIRESSNLKSNNRINNEEVNDDYIEDSYVTDGYSQGPAQNYPMRHPGPPLSFPDPMYRLNLDSRMPAHASGYYHSPLGYGSPMLRMPPPMQSMAVPPPSAHMFNSPHYLPPGNFNVQFPSQLSDQAQNFPASALPVITTSSVIADEPVVSPSSHKVLPPQNVNATSSVLVEQLTTSIPSKI
ncbi:RANBP2-like and GRIP domain-containing protein 8 [Nymphon striatum]|nr:RANBP2-like and GRIP domain-containing protein 8 [Nymphon striatum]